MRKKQYKKKNGIHTKIYAITFNLKYMAIVLVLVFCCHTMITDYLY